MPIKWQKIVTQFKQLYANKMDNHKEMDKFLERYNFPRVNQEELENIEDLSQVMKLKP